MHNHMSQQTKDNFLFQLGRRHVSAGREHKRKLITRTVDLLGFGKNLESVAQLPCSRKSPRFQQVKPYKNQFQRLGSGQERNEVMR